MTDWLPIDTAPKDGTKVILTDGLAVDCAVWIVGSYPDVHMWVIESHPDSGWVSVDFPSPSHWMPLPLPPEAP